MRFPLLLIVGTLALAGCQGRSSPDAVSDRVGASLNRASQDTGAALGRAGNATGNALNRAGNSVSGY